MKQKTPKEIHETWKATLKKRDKDYSTKSPSEKIVILTEIRNGHDKRSNQIAKIDIQIKEIEEKCQKA